MFGVYVIMDDMIMFMLHSWSPRQGKSIHLIMPTALALLFWLLFAGPIMAQEAMQSVSNTVTADQVNVVARDLWCPLCSGVRLDACELKACDQMRQEIAIRLSAGEDADAIKAYFLDQYGPQVLGEPPRSGFNWLAWILPVIGVVGGGLLVWSRMRRLIRPAAEPAAPGSDPPTEDEADDPYRRKLKEELKRL
jgi:cytochrome c-type biogenesis protein CcmH